MNLPKQTAHHSLGPSQNIYITRIERVYSLFSEQGLGSETQWIRAANNSQSKIMTTQKLEEMAGTPAHFSLFSTYAKIFQKLSEYEDILKKGEGDEFKKLSILMVINKEIFTWLHENKNKTSKAPRKLVLEELQKQISEGIEESSEKEAIKRSIPRELLSHLGKSKTPNILFSYLMEKLMSIYKVGEITATNFKTELTKFLVADNDLVGSTSLAILTSGGGASITAGLDPGKTIFPYLNLGIEVKGGAKVTNYRLIATEYQLELNSEKNSEDLKRYCLMNMNGGATEAQLDAKFSIGLEIETPSSDNIIETLEIDSFNCIPQLTPSANAKAELQASVGAGVSGFFLKVSDPKANYFDYLEEIEKELFKIVAYQEIKPLKSDNKKASFALFSHAYSGDAEIHLEASANAILIEKISAGAKLEAKSGVNISAKFSRYTYQNQLFDGTLKTQATTIVFKQASATAKAAASTKLEDGKSKEFGKEKEGKIDLLNSLYYESTFMFQDKSSKKIIPDRSGFSIGHSVTTRNLFSAAKYIRSLAKRLKVKEEVMQDFLNSCHEILLDIFNQQKDGHFIEATFIMPRELELALDTKSESEKLNILQSRSQVLQSLRWRTALQDSKNSDKTWFKLGLNLKVMKLGIELGRIEDASSLKLTDYVVNWYDEIGQKIDMPRKYVPTSFLFM